MRRGGLCAALAGRICCGFWRKDLEEARETWSEWQDLNLRPPRPERGALPDCATLRCQAGGSYSGDPGGPQGASPGPASTGRFAPRLAGRVAEKPPPHTPFWGEILCGGAAPPMCTARSRTLS